MPVLKFPTYPDDSEYPPAPLDQTLGSLCTAIEEHNPLFRLPGLTAAQSFSFWISLITDRRVTAAIAALAKDCGLEPHTQLAQAVEEYALVHFA